MRDSPMFNRPMVSFSLLPKPRSPLPNLFHPRSPSMHKLKSQRVPKIPTEILPRASVKVYRPNLLQSNNNYNHINLLRQLLKPRIYNRFSVKINRFKRLLRPKLYQILIRLPQPRFRSPQTRSHLNNRPLQRWHKTARARW